MVEAPRGPEGLPNRELSLGNFRDGYSLSNRLFASSFGEDAPARVSTNSLPNTLIEAVGNGSHADRVSYWEKSSDKNWGMQMKVWLNGGQVNGTHVEGMNDWLGQQLDKMERGGDSQEAKDLYQVLHSVGLVYKQQPGAEDTQNVQNIFNRINEMLAVAGKAPLTGEEVGTGGALLFYSRYLDAKNPQQRADMTQRLLKDAVQGAAYDIPDDLTGKSEEERSVMADTIFKRLDMVSSLLQVTGEDAQHAVAALLAARVHGTYESEKVQAAARPLGELRDHERHTLGIIHRYHTANEEETQPTSVNPDHPGDSQDHDGDEEEREVAPSDELVERFAQLPGEIDPQKQFFAENPSPVRLTKDQARHLEARRPFFVADETTQGVYHPNPLDHSSLERLSTIQPRFTKGEEVFARPNEEHAPSSYMSGIAAVSAETPRQQAAYYLALADMVIQVHRMDTQLAQEYLNIQDSDSISRYFYVQHELARRKFNFQDYEMQLNQYNGQITQRLMGEYPQLVPLLQQLAQINRVQDPEQFNRQYQQLQSRADYQQYEQRLVAEVTRAMKESTIGEKLLLANESGLLVLQIDPTVMPLGLAIDIEATAKKLQAQLPQLREAVQAGVISREQSEVLTLLSDAVQLEEAARLIQQKSESTLSIVPPEHPADPPGDEHGGETPDPAAEAGVEEGNKDLQFLFGQEYVIKNVYQQVQAAPKEENNPYWVSRELSGDMVEKFGRERGWAGLEVVKPAYQDVHIGFNAKADINPEIFPADNILFDNTRYEEIKSLTHENGLLLALSGASAEMPERQTELYRTLAQMVVGVHGNNPELLQRFLEAQKDSPSETFIAFKEIEDGDGLRQQIEQIFQEKRPMTEEELQAIAASRAAARTIFGKDNRLVALRLDAPDVDAGKSLESFIDVDATVKGWAGRVDKLREALSQKDLRLTTEQMRQLEFLALSVDTTKAIEWLKGEPIDRTLRRRTAPETPATESMESAVPVAPAAPLSQVETMAPPLLDREQTALEQFPKKDREAVKEGAMSAAITYERQRFYYLRSLLLDWTNEQRVGAIEDAVGIISLGNINQFLKDTAKIDNPEAMLELDSVFQGNMSNYVLAKGKDAMRNIFGDLTIAQSEALHTLLQKYANNYMNEEFPTAMRLLGFRVPEQWKEESKTSDSTLSPEMRDALLSLELRVEETTKRFSEDEKKFLKKLLQKMPTRADQLMTILYYYTLWHERQGGNKLLGRKHLISNLRQTADRTKERLGYQPDEQKDELTYFASSQQS